MSFSLRSPLSKARGLGSAKAGFQHWWLQRMTALALIPLALWFCFSMACLPSMTHAEFISWLASPLNAGLMLAVVVAGLYHGALGCQVIIEDYVSHHGVRMAAMIAVKGAAFFAMLLAVVSIIKIATGNSV